MPRDIHTIDAEARGRLRLYKRRLAATQEPLQRFLCSDPLHREATAFAKRSSTVGRMRAYRRLRQQFAAHDTVLCGAITEGKHPLLLWSTLSTGKSVALSDSPSITQDCVTVDFVLAGRLPDKQSCLGAGLWTLEVQDHALGRLLQRTAGADPSPIIMQAHWNALRMRRRDTVEKNDFLESFLLPAGPGCFVCELAFGRSLMRDPTAIQLHVRAMTWLHEDQLYAHQTPLAVEGNESQQMGNSWLLPWPLRRLTCDPETGHANCSVWGGAEIMIEP